MKFRFMWLLIASIPLHCTCQKNSKSTTISSAISQVAEKVFETSKHGFDFIIIKELQKHTKNLLIEEIVSKAGRMISIPHKQRNLSTMNIRGIDRSAIFFFNTWASYFYFQHLIKLKNSLPSEFYFLIVVDEPVENLMQEINKNLPPATYCQFNFENFLVWDEKSLVLKTFERFNQPNCKIYHEIVINRFSNATLKWQNRRFTAKKYENFNGCKMNIAMPYTLDPDNKNLALTANLNSAGKLQLSGYILKFNEVISKSLNYTYSYTPIMLNDTDASYGADYSRELNYNTNISFRLDVSHHRKNKNNMRPSTLALTDRYTTVDEIILISRFKPYSMYEKIFMPFEIEVWQWLVGTLVFLLGVSAFIVVFMPKFVNQFVFGRKVTTPLLNIM
jgi:hypothetical protein